MNAIFSQRLKNARIMQNFSMDELCVRMNNLVSKQSISKYEAGKMMPDSTILIALAKALDVKIDYFFRQFSVSLDSVEFRKKTRLQKRELSAIKEVIRDKVERYIEIENICCITSDFTTDFSNVVVHCEEDVFALITRLKKEWKLGEDGINNLIEILEENKIKVIEIEAPESFDGLSGFIGDKMPIIVLNKSFDTERKRFTALHELGHILLRFDRNLDKKRIEYLCNLFANEMLISRDVFIQMIGNSRQHISFLELRDIQQQFGISVDALMFKARYLNVITEQRFKFFCISKNSNPEFKKEVYLSIAKPESSNRLDRLVYRALASDVISSSKAATLLNVPLTTVLKNLNLL